ncbi:hypothetical protein KP509_32G039800 [Ceratopteris richardii]|nr:hypothetical protein KP509_32G039800 [Ceratopteris richardii]
MSSISVSRCDGTAEERKNDPDNGNLEKRIRALKKKIRTTESLKDSKGPLNAEQLEKISKLEIWQDELNELEAQNGLLK